MVDAEKTLLCLGSNHESDVYDTTLSILREYPIAAITLEQPLGLTRTSDGIHDFPKGRDRLQIENGVTFKVTRNTKMKVIITASGLYVYNEPGQKGNPETNAGIHFALENNLPFYFIERSWEFGDAIFEFYKNILRVISLEGQTTYRNHPDTGLRFREDGSFNLDQYSFSVPARNRFSADVLRHLFERYHHIAHIGGTGHFDSSFRPDDSDPFSRLTHTLPDQSLELQNLLASVNKKVRYDLVRKIAY